MKKPSEKRRGEEFFRSLRDLVRLEKESKIKVHEAGDIAAYKARGLLPFGISNNDGKTETEADSGPIDGPDTIVMCTEATDPLYHADNLVSACAFGCGRILQYHNTTLPLALKVCIPCAMQRIEQGETS